METLIIAGYYTLLSFLVVCLICLLEFIFSAIARIIINVSFRIILTVNSIGHSIRRFRLGFEKFGYRKLTTLIMIGSLITYVKKYISF
jgi:hypothetical protein